MAEVSTFVKLDRNILEWGWFQDSNTVHVFLTLILKANFEDHMFQSELIKRGQLATSYASLMAITGLSQRQVRTALSHLVDTGEVTIKRHSKYSVITVLNYDKYQSMRQSNDRQNVTQKTIKRQANDNNIRSKECKEYKKENTSSSTISIEEARNQ